MLARLVFDGTKLLADPLNDVDEWNDAFWVRYCGTKLRAEAFSENVLGPDVTRDVEDAADEDVLDVETTRDDEKAEYEDGGVLMRAV
jgi:hypothetical protein